VERVQELLLQLQELKMEEQAAKTRGDIFASIVHDINGPLTVMSGFLQILNQRLFNLTHLEMEDLEFIRERHRIMTRQVTNCIEISRRYLGFLRRRSDEAPRVGVNQLLTDLNQLLRVHPSVQNNQFNVELLAEDIGVKINGTDLIQILLNLAVNAFQCSPLGSTVDIGGEVLREPLDLASFKDGPGERLLNVESFANTAPLVRLSVVDTGPGIPEEVLPKIFQPYFTTKGPKQGTGLGLNIVQRLIKECGGALYVKTRVGEGTMFTIYIPAVPLAQ
jgi:signal transduction histidine kinase